MLTLFESVRTAMIRHGQITVPVGCLGWDYYQLEDLFLSVINEYFQFVPIIKQDVFHIDNNGIDAKKWKEVKYIKPHFYADEFNDRMPIETWEFTRDKRLTAVLPMNYFVEYFAEPEIDNFDSDYQEATLLASENSYKFFLKGHFKKGGLKITLKDGNTNYELTEDLSSYDYLKSIFTVDTPTNILTIDSTLGKKLNTFDMIDLTTTGILPYPLLVNPIYYVIKLSDTNIQLATNIINAQNNNAIDITDLGTGVHTIRLANDTDIIKETTEIFLTGSLGTGIVNLSTMEVKFKITASLDSIGKKILLVHFTNTFKACRDLEAKETLFINLFAGYLMRAIGTNKALLKINNGDFPFDVTNDNLIQAGQDLIKETLSDLVERKGLDAMV